MGDQELQEYWQHTTRWVKAFPSNFPRYVQERFPAIQWLPKYSRSWALKDIVAGLTVGLIVVPQGMSYAKVAGLPVQHGLYSAYIGAILYCLMGTSKDLSIGPTAVISLITGELVSQLAGRYSPAEVAAISCLAVGALTLILGVFQLGIVLDFFPSTVLVGYTTGAAVTIVVSQIPRWIGVSGVSTRDPAYLILINTFKSLSTISWLDFAFGSASMLGLYTIGFAVDRWGRGRFSVQMVKISRFFIITVLATVCSYLVNANAPLDHEGNIIPRISILKTVPSGMPATVVPRIDRHILAEIAPKLLAISLATILEHIAIGKAFARKNRYQIDSNQELLTLGAANITASFFGAYTATGSFSRSAVNFQCGVKTPLAGLVTGALVLLSLQFLTPLFYYIPDAVLSAVIMVAVSSLISLPHVFHEFFKVNLWDFLSAQVALWMTLIVSVEVGIASGVAFSLVVLLFRIARPQFQLLQPLRSRPDVFVTSGYSLNHDVNTASLPAGILIFRMEEAATFPNMEAFRTWVQDEVYRHTRFGGLTRSVQDKLWSDNLEKHVQKLRAEREHGNRRVQSHELNSDQDLPYLRAVILDCSSMNKIDSTGLQGLRDLAENLKDYAGVLDNPGVFFELHFAAVQDNVLPILARSGLTNPRTSRLSELHKIQVDGYNSNRTSTSRPPCTDECQDSDIVLESSGLLDRYKDKLNPCYGSYGSLPARRSSRDSLVHLTIRDAIEAVQVHAKAWGKGIDEEEEERESDAGGSGDFSYTSDSDDNSFHKLPSVHRP